MIAIAASIKKIYPQIEKISQIFKLVYVSTCFLVYFQKLIRIFPMRVVVEPVNRPAMLIRVIHQLCECSIAKTEACAGIIRLWGHANYRVHELIQQTAMRNDQISCRLAL